jgi:hypothetical protein
MKRQMARSHGENANPDPIAEIANSNADSSITRMRPYPSATAPANPRAHSRAQQGNGDDEPRDEGTRLEGLLDGVDGAVDDGSVEAEEEAADGCDDRQKENPTGVSPFDRRSRRHDRSPGPDQAFG